MECDKVEVVFDKDVARHEMTIELDNGVHRCIRFARPGTVFYSFRLTTWPGHLAFSGDMGAFVFSRLHDMFEFFRGRGVSLGYWAGKVEAEDRRSGGVKEWSAEAFLDAVRQDVGDYALSRGAPDTFITDVMADADDVSGSEVEAVQWVAKFEAPWHNEATDDEGIFQFEDFWDGVDCKKYTTRFEWCCHAIVWGIAKYDEAKASKEEGGRS